MISVLVCVFLSFFLSVPLSSRRLIPVTLKRLKWRNSLTDCELAYCIHFLYICLNLYVSISVSITLSLSLSIYRYLSLSLFRIGRHRKKKLKFIKFSHFYISQSCFKKSINYFSFVFFFVQCKKRIAAVNEQFFLLKKECCYRCLNKINFFLI